MNQFLLFFAVNPILLWTSAAVGVVLLVWAFARGVRRPRRGLAPGAPGLVLLGLAVAVVVAHPFVLGLDTDHPERLSGVELAAKPADTDDWPQWRGPERNGIGRCPGLRLDWDKNPPEVLWKTPCGGGYSSLAVVGDQVWTQDLHEDVERVICLDAKSGSLRWGYQYPVDYSSLRMGYASGPRATPTVHDGRVYTVGATGKFLCLDANPSEGKGKLLWEHDLLAEFNGRLPQWGVACSPLIEGDLVIVQPGGTKGSVAAFDRKSGKLAWAALQDESGYSSPIAGALAGVRQIVAFTGTRVVGLKPADGSLLWSFDWPTRYNGNIATPILAGDTVFISSDYNSGCALLRITSDGGALNAEPIFVKRGKLMRNHHMTCVLRDGHIYGCDDLRGDLKCVDLRTASEKWDNHRIGKSHIILAEGHLIVLNEQGTLALVEATPDLFRLKGRVDNVLDGRDCWADPALSRGRLYLRDAEKVVCLKVAD